MKALVFGGQGSEVVGMGKDLYREFEAYRELYAYAEECTGLPLREVVFSEEDPRIHETIYAQIALYLFDVFMVDQVLELGLDFAVTFGLSLGEYGSLYAAGVFDKKTGLDVIMHRAQYMSDACSDDQGMAAIIGLTVEELKPLLDEKTVFLANYNTPKQLVISGLKDAVSSVCEEAKSLGAKRALMLSSSGAFHTPFMDEASQLFASYLAGKSFEKPCKKLLCNTSGEVLNGAIKEEMVSQIVSSVYFYQSVEQAIEMGVDTFIEIGPKSVVKGMIKKVDRKVLVLHISTLEDLAKLKDLN